MPQIYIVEYAWNSCCPRGKNADKYNYWLLDKKRMAIAPIYSRYGNIGKQMLHWNLLDEKDNEAIDLVLIFGTEDRDRIQSKSAAV